MKKKKIIFRIREKAPKRYLVEERHTFMWFWHFYIKGSIHVVGLAKFYASAELAQRAIDLGCKKIGREYFILSL